MRKLADFGGSTGHDNISNPGQGGQVVTSSRWVGAGFAPNTPGCNRVLSGPWTCDDEPSAPAGWLYDGLPSPIPAVNTTEILQTENQELESE